jgi:HK97 family phage major capsid protein
MQTLLSLHSDLNENYRKQHALRDLAAKEARNLNASETAYLDALVTESMKVSAGIFKAQGKNTLSAQIFGRDGELTPAALGAGRAPAAGHQITRQGAHIVGEEYQRAFMTFIQSNGKNTPSALSDGFDPIGGGFMFPALPKMEAAGLSEGSLGGSDAAGGYALSIPTVQQIVALGLPDLAMLAASMVIPTSTPVKIPTETAFGGAAFKPESSSGSSNSFAETDPTLGSITLDAYMLGNMRLISWELYQDVEIFGQFATTDLLNSVAIAEDGYYVTGSGSGQPQGIAGNVGTGSGLTYALAGTSADATTILDSLFDTVASLKAVYQSGAVWVLSRVTANVIRRAQMQSNLFSPVFTRDPDGTERILGYPVLYDSNVPSVPTTTNSGTVSAYFGDFKQGYIVGQRGGAGTYVKILDQVYAVQGQIALLGYKRTDGRVRRSEAIQQINFSHS